MRNFSFKIKIQNFDISKRTHRDAENDESGTFGVEEDENDFCFTKKLFNYWEILKFNISIFQNKR